VGAVSNSRRRKEDKEGGNKGVLFLLEAAQQGREKKGDFAVASPTADDGSFEFEPISVAFLLSLFSESL
jgi:hypothetical protein